jgi:hypoxanthine phosphoribosyltransferase
MILVPAGGKLPPDSRGWQFPNSRLKWRKISATYFHSGGLMKILLTEPQLREGIRRLADQIQSQYQGKPLTIVGVLIGSIVLVADLIRLLDMPIRVELVQARSYVSGTRPGPMVINTDLLSDGIQGRDVLLVDDIFDTGRTLSELLPQIDELGPSSIRSAVLLRKQGQCKVDMQPDFVGFDIPNEFVVGYGLDYCDHYRNLPHVAVLETADKKEGDRG